MGSRKLLFISLAILSTTIYSCASYSKRNFSNDFMNIKSENATAINGSYSYHPIKRFYSKRKQKPIDTNLDSLLQNNSYSFILNNFNAHPYKNRKINLRLDSPKKLLVELIEDSKVLEDTLLTGKFKNGMFYLDNKFSDCNGIPFIFGGCRHSKRRIGLTKQGNLLINEAYSRDGALLFIIGSSSTRYNLTYEYLRQ